LEVYEINSDCGDYSIELKIYEDGTESGFYVFFPDHDYGSDFCSESFIEFDFKEAYKSFACDITHEDCFSDIDFDDIDSRKESIIGEVKTFLDDVKKKYKKYELKARLQQDLKTNTNNKSIVKI